MILFLKNYFNFKAHNTNFKIEILGGLTTFFTMAYVLIVNPKILSVAGLPYEAALTATVIIAFSGTFLMSVYAKLPFAVAPYIGENAFIAFTVVKLLGFSWQQAAGAVMVAGILLIILTFLNIRPWLAGSIPVSLKLSFTAGIGLFLTVIGLSESGIILKGEGDVLLRAGNFSSPETLLAILGTVLIAILTAKKVKAAILTGIVITAVLGILAGISELPNEFLSIPPDPSPVFLEADLKGIFEISFLPVLITIFIMAFLDTMGTLSALAIKTGMVNKKGQIPGIKKPMLCDGIATFTAGSLGSASAGVYLESATGIAAGAKTGFASLITAFLFLSALFISPVISSIPGFAYGPALIVIGAFMFSSATGIDFNDFTESFPAFIVIVLMAFSFNIGTGMSAGFLIYPVIKIASGKIKEISIGMWILASLALLFFIFYPYNY